MRRIASMFFFAFLLFASVSGEEGFYRVQGITGEAVVRDRDSFETRKINANDELKSSSKILLRKGAEIKLISPMGDLVILKDKGYVRLSDIVKGDNGESSLSIDLFSGKVNCVVKKRDNARFQVRTPSAVAGVRGTVFSCQVNDIGDSAIAVLQGAVQVSSPEKLFAPVVLENGMVARVSRQSRLALDRLVISGRKDKKEDKSKKEEKKEEEKKAPSGSKVPGAENESSEDGSSGERETKADSPATGKIDDMTEEDDGDASGDDTDEQKKKEVAKEVKANDLSLADDSRGDIEKEIENLPWANREEGDSDSEIGSAGTMGSSAGTDGEVAATDDMTGDMDASSFGADDVADVADGMTGSMDTSSFDSDNVADVADGMTDDVVGGMDEGISDSPAGDSSAVPVDIAGAETALDGLADSGFSLEELDLLDASSDLDLIESTEEVFDAVDIEQQTQDTVNSNMNDIQTIHEQTEILEIPLTIEFEMGN